MPEIVVVGAMNADIGAVSRQKLVARDSNPGIITISPGGVGGNIARNLCLLGADTAMLTALGDDGFGTMLRCEAERVGLDMSCCALLPDQRTSTYLYIAAPDGDMALAVNDMDICRAMTPAFLASRRELLDRASVVVLDANLPQESIVWLCEHCRAPIVADPVSTVKGEKLQKVLPQLYAIKPNRMEAEMLSGVTISTEQDVRRSAQILLDKGVQQVYISLSDKGIYAADRAGHTVRFPCPKVAAVNATGCGDAMTAAIAVGVLRGQTLEQSARFAMMTGAFTATAEGAVHPQMSVEKINKLMGKESI